MVIRTCSSSASRASNAAMICRPPCRLATCPSPASWPAPSAAPGASTCRAAAMAAAAGDLPAGCWGAAPARGWPAGGEVPAEEAAERRSTGIEPRAAGCMGTRSAWSNGKPVTSSRATLCAPAMCAEAFSASCHNLCMDDGDTRHPEVAKAQGGTAHAEPTLICSWLQLCISPKADSYKGICNIAASSWRSSTPTAPTLNKPHPTAPPAADGRRTPGAGSAAHGGRAPGASCAPAAPRGRPPAAPPPAEQNRRRALGRPVRGSAARALASLPRPQRAPAAGFRGHGRPWVRVWDAVCVVSHSGVQCRDMNATVGYIHAACFLEWLTGCGKHHSPSTTGRGGEKCTRTMTSVWCCRRSCRVQPLVICRRWLLQCQAMRLSFNKHCWRRLHVSSACAWQPPESRADGAASELTQLMAEH